MMGRLNGKRVVCVGGASGMGFGVAKAAARDGARVVVTSRSAPKAESAAEQIALGTEGRSVDIGDAASIEAMFDGLEEIDHLMITAGAQGRAAFGATPPDEASAFMDGKLWANHRLIWHARSRMVERGSITLLTGGYAQWATSEAAHVHIAFAATESLARAVAVALAPLRCNVIRPGFVDTSMWDYLPEDERETLRRQEAEATLTRTTVTADDIGDVAVALMTCDAVTGVVVPVDGGRHLRPLA